MDQAAMQQRENAQAVRAVIGETPVKKNARPTANPRLIIQQQRARKQRVDAANAKAVIGKKTALNLVQ